MLHSRAGAKEVAQAVVGRDNGNHHSVTRGFDNVLCAVSPLASVCLQLDLHTCFIVNHLPGSSVG